MGQYRDITIKEVVEELNERYFLPDIQREFVWISGSDQKKIEKLFDSIFRSYPINSFLFWKLNTDDIERTSDIGSKSGDKLNFQLYKFIEDFDIRSPHNDKIDIDKIQSGDINVVLDGQQRLTSLYIGLMGSRTLKKPWYRKDSPNAFVKKKLYINLRHKPSNDNPDDCYQIEFKEPAEIGEPTADTYWFKVGDILNLPSVISYVKAHNLGDDESELLEIMKNAICTDRILSYYEEKDKDLDKVLRIFTRINSGGTPLSYSDLLMSILTATFSSDIRSKMNTLVDGLAKKGFGTMGRDQILKTCLMLTGSQFIFNLRNFNKTNINKIEVNWDKIVNAILDSVTTLDRLGYQYKISSGYIVSTVAHFLFSHDLTWKYFFTADATGLSEREALNKFVRIALIKRFFSTSIDTKLRTVVDDMKDCLTFREFCNKLGKRAEFTVYDKEIDTFLEYQYGDYTTFPLLQMLYPNLDYGNRTFHIDHIYPKSLFTEDNGRLPEDYRNKANCFFNLQLLEGLENEQKNATEPEVWLQKFFNGDSEKIKEEKERNYIPGDFVLKWENIADLEPKRKALMRKKLLEILK